jgi:antitoxin (DNA-binding transcriptional repressor) of toxin-antitoxin stability system
MVAKRVSEAELATNLPEVLERVRIGERFEIERDGEIIAEVIPSGPKPGITLRELALELSRLPPLDDDFAEDIEAAREIVRPTEHPEWPD